MRYLPVVLVVLLICGMVFPVMATDAGRYRYLTIDTVQITLENEDAEIEVNYEIDERVQFLVLLLGKSDLKEKLISVLNFDDAQFREVDMTHAKVMVRKAAVNYGEGSYWFPEQTFGTVIPEIIVKSPQTERRVEMSNVFPNGIGYFE